MKIKFRIRNQWHKE